jgi:7-keto-8-aminopelargonate synthetase-like enzyme
MIWACQFARVFTNWVRTVGNFLTLTIKFAGQTKAQTELEQLVSEFLGVEDAMVFSMGFGKLE